MNTATLVKHEDPQPYAVAETSPNSPASLLRLAIDRGASMDQIERFMALKERSDAIEARKSYVAAMAAFKSDPIVILKRKLVSFTGTKGTTEYKHAELADVCEAIVCRLASHQLSHGWNVEQTPDGAIAVTCVVTHVDGHSESVRMASVADQSGGKNAIQGIASAVSYLQRYTLLAVTGTATKAMTDDDGRAAGVGEIAAMSEEHAATIESVCAEIGPQMLARVRASYKVKNVGEIADSEYTSIVKRLNLNKKEPTT